MEFWGIEVKPGQAVKCEPGNERLLHISQASLGENKKEKGSDNIIIFVKVNDQKLVIGTLSPEKCAQITYDLVFEKDFELSHNSKNTSVFFVGYKTAYQGSEFTSDEDIDDSSSEEEFEITEQLNGKTFKKEQDKPTVDKAAAGKDNSDAIKLKAKAEKPKKEQIKADKKVEDKDTDGSDDDDDDDDDDDSEEDSDSDEDMVKAPGDDSEEEDEDSSEEEATPAKVETGKKRKPGSSSKTPVPDKKAKVITPSQNQKTGGDGKKGGHVHIATPYPSKQGGKPQQTPKSSTESCKPCNRTFISASALRAHNQAKHGAK